MKPSKIALILILVPLLAVSVLNLAKEIKKDFFTHSISVPAQKKPVIYSPAEYYKIDKVIGWESNVYIRFHSADSLILFNDSMRYFYFLNPYENHFGKIFIVRLTNKDIICMGVWGAIDNFSKKNALDMIEIGRFERVPNVFSPVWLLTNKKNYAKTDGGAK